MSLDERIISIQCRQIGERKMKKVMRWILMLSIGAGIGTAGCTRAYQTSGEEWITEEKECVLKICISRTDWKDAVTYLTDSYLESHPEIDDIQWELIEENAYWNLMDMKLALNQLPDIMEVGGGEELVSWYHHLEPLESIWQEKKQEEWVQEGSLIHEIPYSVPIAVYGKGILYNKRILEETGWNHIPNTYRELEQLCKDLEDQNIRPFMNTCYDVTSYAETNLLQMISMKLHPQLYCTLLKNKHQGLIVLDQEWNQMVNFIELTKRYGNRRSLEIEKSLARNYFFIEKYAMLTNDGSYCIKDMKTVEEAGKGEIVIGPLLMSNIPEKNQLQLNVVRLGIMRKSEKKEEAEAFLDWIFHSNQAADILIKYAGAIPAEKNLRKNLTDIAIQTNAYIKAGKVTEDMKGKIPNSIYEDSWELWVKYLAGELNMQEFLVEYQKFLKS